MADRSVSVSLIARFQSFKAGITDARQSTRQFREELGVMSKTHSSAMGGIERGAALAGVAMLGLAGWAVKVGLEFDRQMSAVSAVTNASAADLGRLRTAALAAGKDTVFSATEAAKAEEELAKAGISTADIMGGALSGALSLASAGSLDLAEAADVSAKAMNIWKLRGTDVGHIADVLAAAANKSATDVHEMGMALKMGGLAAKTAGLSLEDTVGTLSAFADSALVGSDAGTSLKTMFMMLSNPTEKSAAAMKKLGINVYDAAGNFVGVEKLAGILQERLGGLTQQQRQAALATIFGSDATRAATVLYEQGAAGIAKYISAVDDQGAASRAAAEKTNNLAGDIERLKGSLETLAITSQSGANGGLRMITQALDHMVSSFSDLPGPVQTAIVVLAGVTGAGLLAGAGFLKIKRTVGDLMGALEGMGPAGTRAAGVLGKVGSAVGKLSLVGIGALAAFEGVQLLGDWLSRNSKPATHDIDMMADSLSRFARSGLATGEMAKTFGADLRGINRDMHAIAAQQQAMATASSGAAFNDNTITRMVDPKNAAGSAASATGLAAAQAKQNLADLDAALAKLATNGGADIARMAMDKLTATTGLGSAAMTQYTAAMQTAATANTGLAHGFGDADANARTLTQSLDDAIAKGATLESVWKQLHGATLSADEALLAAKQAVDDVGKSFEDTGGKIRGNSQAALANRVAMGNAAEKAAVAAEAYRIAGGSISGAEHIMNSQRDAAIRAAIANGGNATEVRRLANELFRMPAKVSSAVSVSGVQNAINQVSTLQQRLNAIPNINRTVTVTTVGSKSGGIGFAEGTDNAPPGWHWVGEHGKELRAFAGGERVKPHAESMAMARAYAGGTGAPVPMSANGAMAVQVNFGAGTDSAFANAFQKLVRTGQITISARAVKD